MLEDIVFQDDRLENVENQAMVAEDYMNENDKTV